MSAPICRCAFRSRCPEGILTIWPRWAPEWTTPDTGKSSLKKGLAGPSVFEKQRARKCLGPTWLQMLELNSNQLLNGGGVAVSGSFKEKVRYSSFKQGWIQVVRQISTEVSVSDPQLYSPLYWLKFHWRLLCTGGSGGRGAGGGKSSYELRQSRSRDPGFEPSGKRASLLQPSHRSCRIIHLPEAELWSYAPGLSQLGLANITDWVA